MQVVVRPMLVEDIPGMVQVFEAVVSAHPGYVSFSELQEGVALDMHTLNPERGVIWHENLTKQFADYPQCQFVAADADTGAVVGFQVVDMIKNDRVCFGILQDFCLLPAYRGGGVGKQLFEAALEQLRHDGVSRIFFESGIENTSFHHWAERWGFTPISMVFMAERPV